MTHDDVIPPHDPKQDDEWSSGTLPPETPQERQCRALLSGTDAERELAKRVYDHELIQRLEREIEADRAKSDY